MTKIQVDDEINGVAGMAWFENKIYVICYQSDRIHVLSDESPYDELIEETIEIEDMKEPMDMAVSKINKSIFISDWKNRCLWKLQILDNTVGQWQLDGLPYGLSTTFCG